MLLTTDNGEKKVAEVIASFRIGKFDGNYVIYKVDDEYYGAKYEENKDETNLITDLSKQEKELITEFYSKLQEGSEKND